MANSSTIIENAFATGILQFRDCDLLHDLYKRKLLTIQQIQRIRFSDLNPSSGYQKASQRVRALEKLGLVSSVTYDLKYVMLTLAGTHIVAGMLDVDVKELISGRRNVPSVQNIEHFRGINETLNLFMDIGRVYEEEVETKIDMGKWFFTPDAQGKLSHRKNMAFYLEFDRNMVSPKIFRNKVTSYERYYLSNKYLDTYEMFPYVLIVTTGGKGRVSSLKKAIEQEKKSDLTFMIADMNTLRISQLDKIWSVPDTDKTYSLLNAGR